MFKKQNGMTLIGFLLAMVGIIIAGILIMRVAPVYIENYEVKSSISALNQLSPSVFSVDAMQNATILKSKLMNQFNINGLYDIKQEQISVKPTGPGVFLVSVQYTVIKPLALHMSLLFEFNESEEVNGGPK